MRTKDYIFCDDIREEVGNKHTLVGVYGEDINFSGPPGLPLKWPINKPLGLFIRLEIEDEDRFNKVVIRFSMDDHEMKLPDMVLPIESDKITTHYLTIAARMEPLPIPGSGTLQASLSFMNDEETISVLKDISITINKNKISGS